MQKTLRCWVCLFVNDWCIAPLKNIVNSIKWNGTINFELLQNDCFTHHWLLFTYLCSSVTLCVVILLWLCQCDKIVHLAVSCIPTYKICTTFFIVSYIFISAAHTGAASSLWEKSVFCQSIQVWLSYLWLSFSEEGAPIWFLVYCGVSGTH